MKDALGSVQTVLVLGGASDIAQATVRAIVAERATTIILAARHPEQLKGFADELAPARVECVAFDARDTGSHEEFVASIWASHPDIDLVLVAFGVLGDHQRTAHDPAAAVEVLETNFVGAASITIAVVERLQAQGHGTLVMLSSVAGERVRPAMFVYGSSKAGIDGFCQGLADSLRASGSGVNVMIVRPGFVHTKMTRNVEPAPFSTTPEQVAGAIIEGVRRDASIVWVPPVLRWIGAGFRHLPRFVWRRIPR